MKSIRRTRVGLSAPPWSRWLLAGVLTSALACSGDDGRDGQDGQDPPEPPTPSALRQGDDTPGVVLAVAALSGGTGPGGTFKVGDTVSVRYTVTKSNAEPWMLSEFTYGRIMISGPTFNYQRVIPEKSDVLTRSVKNTDGSFTYTFADPLPAVYAAPYNDSPSFGIEDGELTGQALLNGTYTVGLYMAWAYTVEGEGHRDSGNVTADFLIGTGTLQPREVVAQDNCNQCHDSLRAHGELRRDVKLCVLCHTAGSEDKNVGSVAGGTPGVSVDFKVMIHKIHNGAHLPSVLGVTTNSDGTRKYDATPQPYQLVGFGNAISDYSHVKFPVWPSLSIAMPRDAGYTALSPTNRAKEDAMRLGVVACDKCHGDPDGAGPLTGPAQGDLYKSQSSRASCGSCHDDVVWGQNYTANTQTMGPQANDSNCLLCHAPAGDPLAVEDAHRHPIYNESFNPGLNVDITAVAESGTNDGDGTIDIGEKVAVTFTITDDAGAAVSPSVNGITSYSVVVSGPTSNSNLLLSGSIPVAALSGSQPYTVNLPQLQVLEFVGTSAGGIGEDFTTAFTPHWNMNGATTSVSTAAVTAPGAGVGSTTLSAAVPMLQNFIDVVSTTGFSNGETLVIDAGQPNEEYLRIQWVDGTRLWFAGAGATVYQPATRLAHSAGATVEEVTLTSMAVTTDYTLSASTGTITTVSDFGAGNAVLINYTSDFVMPSVYPVALNEGTSIDQSWGEWRGLPIASGTYSVGIWGARNLTLNLWGETNSYRGTSWTYSRDFLVGSATALEPYAAIPDATSCYNCHSDMLFHGGGRRGFENCLLCHGTAGSEDRPRYVAPGAPATDGVTINFRTMLHKIHMGRELTNASSYIVNGFGSGGHPNNYTAYTYDEVLFPALPGGAANCTMCHGASSKWYDPTYRTHPDLGAQDIPTREWRATCGACHDSNAATAHIDVQTSTAGLESCAVCHGDGKEWSVRRMHKRY